MTLRDAFYVDAPILGVALLFSQDRMGLGDNGFLIVTSTAANVVNLSYKNEGWYATGSVFEDWVTSGAPSTAPPSGHTLADVGFVVLQN
jgi:hypothetical protein